MNLMTFSEVAAGMEQFADQPDIIAAWKARNDINYIRLEALLQGFAKATTRTVMERLASPLEEDTLETFQAMTRKAALATDIANSVASWQRGAPMLGN